MFSQIVTPFKRSFYYSNSINCLLRASITTTTTNSSNFNTNEYKPKEIKLSEKGKRLEISFNNNSNENSNNNIKYSFSSELLRIETPSVEKNKKGLSMITGRRDVSIIRIERVGNYAIRLVFDDLHDTGIYSWQYLFELGKNKYSKMKLYLKELKQYGKSRDPKIHNKQLKLKQQTSPKQ